MNSGELHKRKRQILLFLSAILIPSIVVITLAVRLTRQDVELAEKRASDQRQAALEQLRRELGARLETIKLQELNRLADGSIPAPSDSPVVFVAPVIQNRLALPWEAPRQAGASSSMFSKLRLEGEAREFLGDDFSGAVDAYRQAMLAARNPSDQCAARLWDGRALVKAGRKPEALDVYHSMLTACDSLNDDEGMAFGLYAAERLISVDLDVHAGRQYVLKRAQSLGWLPPVQVYLLRSLVSDIQGVEADAARTSLTAAIHDAEQILSLANDLNRLGRADFPFHASPGKSVWLAYGDEPWLLTMMSTASFSPPVVLAVSSKKISPPDVKFVANSEGSSPLGEGFVDLHVEWAPERFETAPAASASLYAVVIALILGFTMLAGYLLLRDVSREFQVSEMRSHFVASVSHELKTPLTAIRMFAETLAMGRAGDEKIRNEYLRTVVNESERLSRLVDNVLDFSRIEGGKKIYRMQPGVLGDVVQAAARAMHYPLTQLGFTLNVRIDDDLPMAMIDADALEQAVLNLLANAMKYSGDSREIDLRLKRAGKEAVIEVIDRGIGIAADDQNRIFEKFYRVRSSQSDRVAGTGLGLTLATHIVRAHGGRLEVASELTRGSTFCICLPLKPPGVKV